MVDSQYSEDVETDKDDTAFYSRLAAYWQHKWNDRFGLRADYNVYADAHHDFDENDLVEQLISLEPQWFQNNFIYSLPLQYNYTMEDNDSDYHRYSIAPTLTVKFPALNHAVEAYGMASKINDVDEYVDFDEDGYSLGGGLGYLIFSKNRTYFRIAGDHHRIRYDSKGNDYINTVTTDKRQDLVTSLGAEHNIQITDYCDLNLNYTYIHTHSNVKFYDYDKHILQAGVSLNF